MPVQGIGRESPGFQQMNANIELGKFLSSWAGADADRAAVAAVVRAVAEAGVQIAACVSRGALAQSLGVVKGRSEEADVQKQLDLSANEVLIECLREAPVAVIASTELDAPVVIEPGAPLAVAIDPLDGSANFDTNATLGTIFSVLPAKSNGSPEAAFLQPGTSQLAAGFVVHGPQTVLVFSLGEGTSVFTYDRDLHTFLLSNPSARVAGEAREYAINASNYRHWGEAIRMYVDDIIKGDEGPRGENFNMRWGPSPVAEVYRILVRGGIYLYPADSRKGYTQGRFRLVFAASPIAFVVEQAGGGASTGEERILDLVPRALDQRVPLIVGSKGEVDYVARLHQEPHAHGLRSPLFGHRGLFRV